jgi:DNA repair protein RadA/Sms
LFLGDRDRTASGSAVTALLEGTRPVLVEVQALAAKAGFGTPQRVATGYDNRRLALLLAVLDKRAELSFASLDVFLNVVGGVRMQEPAGDLAVTAALASSVFDRALPSNAIFIGEVGLGGEVRPVSQIERRLAEAAKMGMHVGYVADRGVPRRAPSALRVEGVATLHALFSRLFL